MPKGSNTVVFKYIPMLFYIGLVLIGCSALCCVSGFDRGIEGCCFGFKMAEIIPDPKANGGG